MKSLRQLHVITDDHRSREAVVYVRQSSAGQVQENVESAQIQRRMREDAIALGWSQATIIDVDLGISASGLAERPGFRELLARVANRHVGIIFCIDASRLSRNSKDWAELFELCGHFDTLIADHNQVYDLSNPNDRMVMGIKGTVSEMELGLIRQRMRSGREAKAARGELRYLLPVGYAFDSDGRVVFHPDSRVRKAIEALFHHFDGSTSVRQLALWYCDTKTQFPSRSTTQNGPIRWMIPSAHTLMRLLTHPFYAGAYVYGRRKNTVEFFGGKLKKRCRGTGPWEDARVLIQDHHPSYISWQRFLENRAKISENRPRWTMRDNRGAIREGLALLAGMLRCVKCGGRVRVSYKKASALYYCDGSQVGISGRCLSFGSMSIDAQVGEELARALAPLGLQASIRAAQLADGQRSEQIESARLQVEAAQYQADRALEQFDLCDPKNRHVTATLEERLNDRLGELQAVKNRFEQVINSEPSLNEENRIQLERLGQNFPEVWNHPEASPKLKKRLLRAAIQEILVGPLHGDGRLDVIVHWQGGAHTQFQVQGPVRTTSQNLKPLEQLVTELAKHFPDPEIARILNMKKLTTPGGLRWSKDRVAKFRNQHRIPGPQKPTAEWMTMNQSAQYLGIGMSAIAALAARGIITTNQITDFAPWRVSREELDSDEVRRLIGTLKRTGRLPTGGCSGGQAELFGEK